MKHIRSERRTYKKSLAHPKDFDISDVKTSYAVQDSNTINAGLIKEWEHLTFKEKTKVRPYITLIVTLLWVGYTIAGVIRWVTVGDTSLLITSPILLIGPLQQVLAFYFRE